MKKTLAIMLALIMVLALVPTVAFAEEPNKIYVDATNGKDDQEGVGTTSDKAYKSLDKAMEAAVSGDTIYLAAGTYCGNSANPSQAGNGAKKNLTFVGAGSDKTTWQIRAMENNTSGDGPCDYSFDGSDRITFEKMTVVGSVYPDGITIKANDYQGFVRINHLKLKDCTFNGRADYWGYETTEFENVTFYAPGTEASGIKGVGYSLWTWTGTEYTFNNCTFNSAGKVINVYHEDPKIATTINFNNCTVSSTEPESLSVMNINDTYVDSFTINFNGKNTINDIKADGIHETDGSHASAAKDTANKKKTSEQATCSKLFEFNMKYGNGNNGKTTVKIDGQTVWKGGQRVSHAIDTENDKYTDGYKDNAFEIIKDDTTGVYVKTCKYCGYTEPFYGELSNEIGLKRTVRQGQEVKIETTNPKDTYKVNGSSGITVDYTATMDMTKLKWEKQGSLYDDEITPWQMLAMQPGWITKDTVVFLKFTFDKNIDLGTFQTNYNNATTSEAKEKLLKLESNMFKIADEGGVQFDIEKREMTIKCNWNWNKETGHAPEPKITLNGYGLPVKNDWNGSKQIDITNSGCVSGTVHIKYINPRPDAKKIAETVHNVAANVQVQNTTPPEISPTIQIPIVGGCKTDEFTLYYGGGSSGDSGHSHYYPTTTPVPVIVIPPKTGDMTVWQSILHFLGIR